MNLPIGNYDWYCGIDPGNKGAFGLMDAKGGNIRVWTMPPPEDINGLYDIFQALPENIAVGIEWPTSWPHSFGNAVNHANSFGQWMGRLEAMACCHGLEYFKISPQLWKGRLGLDGKQVEGSNERAAALWDTFYREFAHVIRGVRGGLLDGNMDALLIAHFMRTRTAVGMKSIADKFGKDSAEAFAFIMGGGRRKRKFGRLTSDLK